MKKKVAILTQKNSLSNDLQDNTNINIFDMEEDKVVEYENIKIEEKEYNQFSSLLSKKKINLLYLNTITNEFKNILEKLGIIVKVKDEFSDDKFIDQFIFD